MLQNLHVTIKRKYFIIIYILVIFTNVIVQISLILSFNEKWYYPALYNAVVFTIKCYVVYFVKCLSLFTIHHVNDLLC